MKASQASSIKCGWCYTTHWIAWYMDFSSNI